MHISRSTVKRSPISAPATPQIDRIDLGEYRLPFMMSQQLTGRKTRGREEMSLATTPKETLEGSPVMSTATIPSSPATPKQSPLHLMPPSPVSGMSPTRKESYKDLISRAISSHPDKLMTLSDIYAWIVANVDAYRDQSHIPSTQGWKNAIRHTLSFYKCFKRVKRHPSIEKPSYWTIDYSEQQTGPASVATTSLIPASPKSTATSVISAGPITASTIARPIATVPTSVRPVAREELVSEEQTRTHDLGTNSADLRAWAANWPLRSDGNASKEEQCIQGLLLFRTSGGFSFLPQSSEFRLTTTSSTATTTTVLPKLPASPWTVGEHSSSVGDTLTYTSCAQAYAQQEPAETRSYATSRFENGVGKAHGSQPSGGATVTLVVDTLASTRTPLTSTWTMAAMRENERKEPQEQSLKRKSQLQKRYLETSSLVSVQQQPQAKPESVSYVQLISNAILATPEKRATLAQIYDWLVANVAAYQGQGASPSSVGWKNAVRHTLSTRPFFKRVICDEAFGRQKPAWWTVDVEAMTLASSLRQQQQNQLKITRRRKNGHTVVEESVSGKKETDFSAPQTSTSPFFNQTSTHTGIGFTCHAIQEGAITLEKAASEPPEPIRANEGIKWAAHGAIDKEVVSSPEVAVHRSSIVPVFRFPSTSSGTTTSTVMTYRSEMVSPVEKMYRSADVPLSSYMVKNAVFESAIGMEAEIFDCLLKDSTLILDKNASSLCNELSPRDALIYTLLRLHRQPPCSQSVRSQRLQPKLTMRRLYLRCLALLSAQLSPLIIWPNPDSVSLPQTYLTDRLVTIERMPTPENVVGILDIITVQVVFDHGDECCQKTINAVIVYNFDGAVIYRSKKLYWLDCMHHSSAFQAGLRSMIEECVEMELNEKLASLNGGKFLLAYKSVGDVLPLSVYPIQSRIVRNLLREKFGDRFSCFDILTKPIMLKRRGSSPITTLSILDDALTVCSGLLNLSPSITWDDGSV